MTFQINSSVSKKKKKRNFVNLDNISKEEETKLIKKIASLMRETIGMHSGIKAQEALINLKNTSFSTIYPGDTVRVQYSFSIDGQTIIDLLNSKENKLNGQGIFLRSIEIEQNK